ncbi:DUF2017 domain-containing protein [Auraticoccus monumenti]|uniref:Uncharacterized protein n=1 Tax=Auraticoccus monumenti TaxID=675864 RepID=A0A1G6ZE93_9ACTN|nr:DUF2017 domain-containing protein [Auraticoccus monumenti]SDE00861.1 protein of unknown function [Auraticoccus monumenti]
MRRFERRRKQVVASFEPEEVQLLASLTEQLVELLTEHEHPPGSEPAPQPPTADVDDPFAMWERDLAEEPDQPEVPDDPVLQRLFPNAYPHDPQASADFRRYTERDARTAKIDAARTVLAALAASRDGRDPVRVPLAEADAWLKTLTNLRLSIATRLQITDAESGEELSQLPDDDPRAFMYGVYEWLAFAQETLVAAL